MPKDIKNIKLVIFDVNETMFSLANINYLFKNFGLPPNTSDLWFANVLKEGFACSSHGSFCTFIDIGANELKKLFCTLKRRLGRVEDLVAHSKYVSTLVSALVSALVSTSVRRLGHVEDLEAHRKYVSTLVYGGMQSRG